MSDNGRDKMDALLGALEAEAKTVIRAFAGVGTVPSENVLNADMVFPFLALRDGSVEYGNMSNASDKILEVTFWIMVDIMDRPWLEALFSSNNNQGILSLARLVENTFIHFNPPGFGFLGVISRTGSEFVDALDQAGNQVRTMQRLAITMQWSEC